MQTKDVYVSVGMVSSLLTDFLKRLVCIFSKYTSEQ
jgi:hypothetical protein